MSDFHEETSKKRSNAESDEEMDSEEKCTKWLDKYFASTSSDEDTIIIPSKSAPTLNEDKKEGHFCSSEGDNTIDLLSNSTDSNRSKKKNQYFSSDSDVTIDLLSNSTGSNANGKTQSWSSGSDDVLDLLANSTDSSKSGHSASVDSGDDIIWEDLMSDSADDTHEQPMVSSPSSDYITRGHSRSKSNDKTNKN